MRKKIKFLAVLLALSFFGALPVLAQTAPLTTSLMSPTNGSNNEIVLATVNIYNAKIVSQDNNNLKIAFDLNNQEQIQPGVRYAVLLSGTGGNSDQSDQKIYANTLTLASNSTIHEEADYTAPTWLSGSFTVWVISKSINGLPLGQSLAGTVNLTGQTNNSVELNGCFVKVSGQDKQYALDQGVDIAPAENLVLTCNVKNNFSSNVSLTPNFDTHYRSAFGDLVSSSKGAAVTLPANSTKAVDFALPKANAPQSYDVLFTLLNDQGQAVSSAIDTHYVLDGPSGTISNLRLDKNSYVQGDAAQAILNWTGSADSFPGARNGSTDTESDIINLAITSNGQSCSNPFEKKLSDISSNPVSATISLPITADCPNPLVTAILKDAKGNVLNKFTFLTNSQQTNSSFQTPAEAASQSTAQSAPWTKVISIVILILVVILAVIIFIKLAWKNKNSTHVGLFLVIFLSLGLLWAQPSRANTFVVQNFGVCSPPGISGFVDCYGYYYVVFSASMSPGPYQPGSSAPVTSAEPVAYNCGNAAVNYKLSATTLSNPTPLTLQCSGSAYKCSVSPPKVTTCKNPGNIWQGVPPSGCTSTGGPESSDCWGCFSSGGGGGWGGLGILGCTSSCWAPPTGTTCTLGNGRGSGGICSGSLKVEATGGNPSPSATKCNAYVSCTDWKNHCALGGAGCPATCAAGLPYCMSSAKTAAYCVPGSPYCATFTARATANGAFGEGWYPDTQIGLPYTVTGLSGSCSVTSPDPNSSACLSPPNSAPTANNTPNKLVSSCSADNGPCEYYCDDSTYQGGKCVAPAPSCTPQTCQPADQICQGTSCDPGCNSQIITGTKNCAGWKEVAP